MQDCVNSNKIKENKYKILRMSLLLGSGVDREDTYNNFEDAAREIDAMNDEVYLKNIDDKFYDTLKLEDEEKKLAVLVDYIGGRVEQRISLLSDFANVTGYDLQNLPSIKYYDKLDDYKERLGYIREYLSNVEQIEELTEDIEIADKKLNEAYLNRASSEEYNKKIEDTLLDKFVSVFKSLDYFEEISNGNIEEKLNSVMYLVEDSKKSLDIFTKSFTTLTGSGISLEEENEYLSYVDNARYAYYAYKEQEYVIRIYKLLLSKYTDYNQILYKREEINDILYERLKLRKELKISSNDLFSSVYDLLERQYDDIKRQSVDIENIEKLTSKINEKREELNRLELENQKVEILSLLREFCIIDTYNDVSSNNDILSDEFESSDNDEANSDVSFDIDNISEEINDDSNQIREIDNEAVIDVSDIIGTSEELKYDSNVDIVDKVDNSNVDKVDNSNVDKVDKVDNSNVDVTDNSVSVEVNDSIFGEDVLDNQVVLVEDVNGIDLELIRSKANKVMKRVGEMLGIKVEETEVVSVTSDIKDKEENIFMNDNTSEISDNASVDNVALADTEIENPLFSNELKEEEDTAMNNPLFMDNNSSLGEFSLPDGDEISNDFWFSNDTPDALNELPDLNISNDDFFANNNVADLQFPDLNMNFPDDDMEEKI